MIDLPDGVAFEDGDAPRIAVDTPAGRGVVHLDGATVTSWVPAGGEEVFFVSEQSRFGEGVHIRGGVPLCAPWFGPGLSKDRTPAHGFFRSVRWTLTEARRDGDTVTLVLTLPPLADIAHVDGVDSAPADLSATYTVTLGEDLTLSLETTSPSTALELENALHAYLRVSDVKAVTVEGLAGSRYADKAPGGRAVNAQSGPVKLLRETDRVYASAEPVVLVDGDRRVTFTKTGSNSTVVWNPWLRKAADLSDFGDDEWQRMICIEPANALTGHVELAAGESHTLTATISLD
ncbi:MAG: D-hexose-6-phosphate mutarotase [Mobilicoccus sp.]|nr:D-hexose-6-phosphate mutarotase [Mobilicoccus sp.]